MSNSNDLPNSSLNLIDSIYKNKVDTTLKYQDQFEAYFAACQRVAEELNLHLSKPSIDLTRNPSAVDYLHLVAENNAIQLRKIHLKSNWWKADYGPLLVLYNQQLCALIPNNKMEYTLFNFKEGTQKKINKELGAEIALDAYLFYQTFPKKRLGLKEIVAFAISGVKSDLVKFIIYQLINSAILLVVPILTAVIFDEVIPNSNLSLLTEYSGILAVTVVTVVLVQLLQTMLLLRIKIKIQYKTQVGVWDRLINLPLSFFKPFSAGDLAYRLVIPQLIQERLSANAISAIVTGLASIAYLGLMTYIDFFLASVVLAMILVLFIFTVTMNWLILKQERTITKINSSLFGTLLNLVNSIMKIRVANKEKEAYELWQKEVSEKFIASNRVSNLQGGVEVFNIGFLGLSTLVLYSLVGWREDSISFSHFIIFNAAFVSYVSALTALTKALSESIDVLPLFKQAKPIFDSLPEDNSSKNRNISLDGVINLQNIVFRYPGSEKPVLTNFNLTIEPGSFTAIVGASGSGKSTILRLMLGLESAESGQILYNGINLMNLDSHWLRSQIGTVMQSSQPFPGSIFENIAGNNYDLTREEAWEIVEKVGLKATIKALPMGMDTLLSDGIQTFSGGELQRLNIARALSANPQIILFDEATSALDNKAQHLIQETLESLKVTRVIIAHRLSTIRSADIIHVIDSGQCIESGTYTELLAKQGYFYQFTKKKRLLY
ncbi:Alpha-hemolysin translocation ATP-binding protein HlyB [Legionella massiliensis]|uniref:Alpha-hemolysin translocation ATP-binding protein HlyB n=1 Tax=Legionella massiliensis TaxID=1034943 RepID=A0A078L0H6_9GAMM|nr:ATP-binding cassette domain-containing protein [Legionella massiliensis]CDZ77549.1 Alpha-hemolysin translocation ATP-binding protein HlyB [Legionella massiliensis]CEE13287.1 Alpha-hemolysin translocation ATP-binding protein HlyB [Legionella massiliensis]